VKPHSKVRINLLIQLTNREQALYGPFEPQNHGLRFTAVGETTQSPQSVV